jgi:hypothetical protein
MRHHGDERHREQDEANGQSGDRPGVGSKVLG